MKSNVVVVNVDKVNIQSGLFVGFFDDFLKVEDFLVFMVSELVFPVILENWQPGQIGHGFKEDNQGDVFNDFYSVIDILLFLLIVQIGLLVLFDLFVSHTVVYDLNVFIELFVDNVEGYKIGGDDATDDNN